MRFHGTATSRAYSANVRSHFPESGSGRAALAGAAAETQMTPSASTRIARSKALALVEDRPGDVLRVRAEPDRVLALLVHLERHRGVAHAREHGRSAVLALIAV